MKRLGLIWMVFMASCSEDQDFDNINSEWAVSWEVADEEVRGNLLLYNDQYAKLQVYGDSNSLLVKDSEKVTFYWERNKNKLTLTRIDNEVELTYDILNENPEHVELSFAGDIKVTLTRQ